MINKIKEKYTIWFYKSGYLNIYEESVMFRIFYRLLFDNKTYLRLLGNEIGIIKDVSKKLIQCKKLSGNYNEDDYQLITNILNI